MTSEPPAAACGGAPAAGNDAFARITSGVLVVAVVAAAIGVAVAGDFGRALDSLAVIALAALPPLRVVVLAVRWTRMGDRRYATAALGLLVAMTVAVTVVATWR